MKSENYILVHTYGSYFCGLSNRGRVVLASNLKNAKQMSLKEVVTYKKELWDATNWKIFSVFIKFVGELEFEHLQRKEELQDQICRCERVLAELDVVLATLGNG
jgi:DNA-binding transcriptional regulator of glucitol operon